MWETLKRCRNEKSVKVPKHSNMVGYTTLVTILPSVKCPLSRSSQFLLLLTEFFLLSLGYFRSFPELTDFQNMPKVKTFQKNYCWKISEKHLSPQIWYHLLYAYTKKFVILLQTWKMFVYLSLFVKHSFVYHSNQWPLLSWWALELALPLSEDLYRIGMSRNRMVSNLLLYAGKEHLVGRKINPLHPNISMHILHTVLYTFPKVLTRRICLTIKSFFSWWSFSLFLWP